MSKANKIYLESIRRLPKKWIDEETYLCTYFYKFIIAANPKFEPIVYENGKWKKLGIDWDYEKR